MWVFRSGCDHPVAATINGYYPTSSKPYAVRTDTDNYFRVIGQDLARRVPGQDYLPSDELLFKIDDRVIYCCPTSKEEYLGVVLEADLSSTPPYILLLEGEETVSAFPADLKRAPEPDENNSDHGERNERPPDRQPHRNQEGAGNDPPSDPSEDNHSSKSSDSGSSKKKKKTNKSMKKSLKKNG